MRYLNIFVAGSTRGLEKERDEINRIVHVINQTNKKQSEGNHLVERTFITVSSFLNFQSQMCQGLINEAIRNDVDCAIFLLSADDVDLDKSKSNDKVYTCIGQFTRSEIKTVIENDIPIEIFIKEATCEDKTMRIRKNERAEEEIEALLKEISKHKIDDNKLYQNPCDQEQFYYYADRISAVLPALFQNLTVKRVEEITWANDNFAYYTIEARMKETFKEYLKSYLGEKCFDDFLDRGVYGMSDKECVEKVINDPDILEEKRRMLSVVDGELSSIISKYKPANNGEHHYDYLRRVPFLVSEFYFYYYILYLFLTKCEGYDKSYSYSVMNLQVLDPYHESKKKAVDNFFKTLTPAAVSFRLLFNDDYAKDRSRFSSALFHCVSTNSTDLSQLKDDQSASKVCNRLIIDDSDAVYDYLHSDQSTSGKAIYILDNYGPELISDLLFGLYLLKHCGYKEIEYYVKELPIFVSDTTMGDVRELFQENEREKLFLEWLRNCSGNSLEVIEEGGLDFIVSCKDTDAKMIFKASPQLHRPESFETFFPSITDGVTLVVVKGDMNYRRLVKDRNYDFFDDIENYVDYIEKPLLVLRSLKSNVLLGVETRRLDGVKPNWKTSGEYGIIHFVRSKDKSKNKSI